MITITVQDEAISAALTRLMAAVSDMRPAMNDIGQALVISSKARIDQGVTPEGAAFAALSPTTLAAYANAKPPKVSRGPLKQSGMMQSQIFHSYGSDHAEVSSNAIQAAVMQFGAARGQFGTTSRGGSIPWGNIPARPFLGVSDEDRVMIHDIVEEWLSDAALTG